MSLVFLKGALNYRAQTDELIEAPNGTSRNTFTMQDIYGNDISLQIDL